MYCDFSVWNMLSFCFSEGMEFCSWRRLIWLCLCHFLPQPGFIHFLSQWTTFISLNCGSISLDRAWVVERQDTWDQAGLSCSLETHYFTRFIQYEVKTASKGASSVSKVSWSQMKSLDMVGYAYSPSAREPEKWSFLGSVVSPFSLTGRVYANERAHLNTNVWPLRDNTQSYPPD